jgi:hypothetical protein
MKFLGCFEDDYDLNKLYASNKKIICSERLKKEKVAPRFELGMEALQATALPLGYATLKG